MFGADGIVDISQSEVVIGAEEKERSFVSLPLCFMIVVGMEVELLQFTNLDSLERMLERTKHTELHQMKLTAARLDPKFFFEVVDLENKNV